MSILPKSKALAAALALLLASSAFAARPITPPAPEFPDHAAWINSKPFTLRQLRKRRVVLCVFLDTDSLNSLRAIETLKIWQKRYEFAGLLIIGIHTPDLAFQKDPRHVRAQFKRLGVDFPIVMDNTRELWQGYGNEGWPAFYLIDKHGLVVFDRLGEGGYAEFETEIRAALADAGFDPVPSEKPVPEHKGLDCGETTRDVSVGLRRGSPINLERNSDRAGSTYLLSVRQSETGYAGSWDAEPDALRLAQKNDSQTAYIRVLYRGAQAFGLLGPPLGGSRYYVRQDDLWLHSGNGGADIRFDDDGRSFVDAAEARLYHLAQNPSDSMHELVLSPVKAGSAVYGFSFTDRCLTVQLPQ